VASIECFLIEPTEYYRRYLRRFTHGGRNVCGQGEFTYHEDKVLLDVVASDVQPASSEDIWPHDDPVWPKTCRRCDYQFIVQRVFKRDNGGYSYDFMTLLDASPGAMWFATWLEDLEWHGKGPDGRILVVKTPGGDWTVDGRATNCTKPDDTEHRCWVRQGTPPKVTVSKNGNTCNSGAGSIGIGSYHGFLRDGHLVDA
jgi:hypothetical protein